MGVCVSRELREQRKRHTVIERDLLITAAVERRVQKLLLLGAAECGKSTILKQMRILHDSGFTDEEAEIQRGTIYSIIAQGMMTIINAREKLGTVGSSTEADLYIPEVRTWCRIKMDRERFTPDVYKALKKLWQDQSIQQCYVRRSEYQLADSVKYFLDELDRIWAEDYKPSNQDMLYIRIQTTGVSEVRFEIRNFTFRVFDVGGQRSERKKWIYCFDNVNAIIFLAAISEYDQLLVEDEKTNRIHEAVNLFEQIFNSPVFNPKLSLILFLNKIDLFAEKLKRKSIRIAYPDYKGEDAYDEAVAFISKQFEQTRGELTEKKLYVHHTCATDTTQVSKVLEGVIDTIIRNNMKGSGIA